MGVAVATPQTSAVAQTPQSRGGESGRGRARTPGNAGSRQGSLGRCPESSRGREPMRDQRGKKRRPTSQEPRAVSAIAPPPRKVQALPQVEEFLKETNCRCQKINLNATFRNISYGQQAKKKQGEKAASSLPSLDGTDGKASAKSSPPLSPWEEYFRANNHFIRNGQFMHTVAFIAEGRRVLAVVPHPKRVCIERLARAIQKPESAIKQRKLNDISRETGFPVFVCPPFGHPKDSEGRLPTLLVDSSATEVKRPLLFDCGTVGLSVMPSEFISMTRASCIEGLAVDPPPPQTAAAVSSAAASGAVKAPATNAESKENSTVPSTEMEVSGLPVNLTPETGTKQAEVQQPASSADSSCDTAMGS